MKTRTPSHEVRRVVGSDTNSSISQSRPPRGSKEIVVPFQRETYHEIVRDRIEFKKYLNGQYDMHPELFPEAMKHGYQLDGFTEPSKKLGVIQRRMLIKETKDVFTIKPSFVMPYMTGYTETVENGLLLVKYKVPYWVIARIFGRNEMYWWRMFVSLGRNSIVGTTVKDPEKIPKDINADEKKTRMNGKEINIATTVGDECILGAAICTERSEDALKEGYSAFKEEARSANPDYAPESVNTDGSDALQNAFKSLFPNAILILCYLHSVLNIKKRGKRLGALFQEIMSRVWHVYHAETKRAFSQRMRRLKEWAIENVGEGVVLDKILSLCKKSRRFQVYYDHENAHRTSNMIDRLMDVQDRFLYIMKYFHGHFMSAELGIRAWAILMNFGPYCPRATTEKGGWVCAAQKLNGFRYSDDWLENLLISSSMNGYRR